MDVNMMISDFRDWLNTLTHNDWFGTVATIVIIAIVCAALSHLSAITLRKFLKSSKGPLPSVSIFVNIVRVIIWVTGLSIVLSSCFNVNIASAITALGIGGIAISLGFQSTLSNLISGIQIIIIGLVEPGDHISVGNYEGIVQDVTWRHTTIVTARGDRVIIPNSVLNSDALVKLPPELNINMEITIKPDDEEIDSVLEKMEGAVKEAITKIAVVIKEPKIRLVGLDNFGYKAQLTFVVEKGVEKPQLLDAAMKAIDTVKHQKTA